MSSLLSAGPSPRRSEDDMQRPEFHAPAYGPRRARKKFVLCFDGTGNKFQGDESDSNILKIFRMLDRTVDDQFHYYQPGIGTYTTSGGLSHTSMSARFSSWYQKAKDSAVGTSFDEHVMAGYKFLMRYYTPGDDIFFFGFSRGAYIARFLAEMLDYVGLLSAGNEELSRFAWKTFSQWQQRLNETEEDRKNSAKLFKYMEGFRNTFSRPVRRIRFLGLFDTVNSVPRFESSWMQRSKFPYTARSSAKVIRHAVGIDERRAKFRQDLISQPPQRTQKGQHHKHHWAQLHHPTIGSAYRVRRGARTDRLGPPAGNDEKDPKDTRNGVGQTSDRFRQIHRDPRLSVAGQPNGPTRYRSRSRASHVQSRAPSQAPSMELAGPSGHDSIQADAEASHLAHQPEVDSESDDEQETNQDIAEVWFPGCHADIGGGWGLADGENYALSHGPLVWMVREASRAGLRFDPETMADLCCCEDESSYFSTQQTRSNTVPQIRISEGTPMGRDEKPAVKKNDDSKYIEALREGGTLGRIHDCLAFDNGLPRGSVVSWNIMEYLPFRRMDLQPDGSWKPIRWPLPMGETRDIPDGAWIHNSVLKRMDANENYRPGNLLVGGGGRGVRKAPPEYGVGEWDVLREEGDPAGEVLTRRHPSEKKEG
ncbi:MAG: hypothetical protein M4579_002275 [Chaenotheca gracillima]|nr:MAG: hypothetical protein M4579_002275 [Chaenotheca gracillima]